MFGGAEAEADSGFRPVDTVLGPGTEVKGTVKAEGTLRIDGAVDGEIEDKWRSHRERKRPPKRLTFMAAMPLWPGK